MSMVRWSAIAALTQPSGVRQGRKLSTGVKSTVLLTNTLTQQINQGLQDTAKSVLRITPKTLGRLALSMPKDHTRAKLYGPRSRISLDL